eukprot:TRINITY_DN120288_c0_g1_i1.p1 TRINITY_DN120288_c0_g1~~TRINITY_DN120288_c0_g1_i1.p1  ORF type:complete len:560 (+),score=74.02 TRINITY_DN120288_c0_g1_i1:106-1680(+)
MGDKTTQCQHFKLVGYDQKVVKQVDGPQAKINVKGMMRSLLCKVIYRMGKDRQTCAEILRDGAQRKKNRKKKKKKQKLLGEAIICLNCCNIFCVSHAKEHSSDHPLRLNTKTREIICKECDVDLKKLVKKEDKNPIRELVLDLVDKVVGESKESDYEEELKEFLNQIYSGMGAKEDFDSDKAVSGETTATETSPSESPTHLNEDFIELSATDLPSAEDIEKYAKRQEHLKALAASQGIKGLQNLGNTCYFNSVMQCLNASSELVELLITKPIISKAPENVKLPPLILRKRLRDFFTAMREVKGSVHNPEPVLDAVRAKYPKFKGYHQQDSHELLMSVLDRLIEEEQALYKAVNQGKNANFFDTTVAKLFGSKLVNKVSCLGCGTIYWIFDPCTVYSLPMSCRGKEIVYKYRKVERRGKKKRGKKYRNKEEEVVVEEEVKERKELKASDILPPPTEEKVEKYERVTINETEYLEPYKPPVNYHAEEQLKTLKDCLELFFNKEVLCEQNGNSFACSKCIDPTGILF